MVRILLKSRGYSRIFEDIYDVWDEMAVRGRSLRGLCLVPRV